MVNSYHTEFFWENIKVYLYFRSFLDSETWQTVEIYYQGRQEYPSTMQAVNIMAADDLGLESI